MHTKGMRLCSRMTRAHFRRWVICVIEKTLKYSVAMIVMSCGCVVVALAVGLFLNILGVSYG